MAAESATTSPPALAGSSFSIENLLNLSQGATEKKPTARLSTATSTCDSLRRPSFPLVPKAVRPFAYHAHSLPLCTPDPGLHFGGIPHPRSEPSIDHFPIPNNGPPLGVELFTIRRRRPMRKKKQRPLFSPHQIQTMETEFTKCQYVSESRRAELASDLNLTETQVKTWFQNRRTKSKKETRDKQDQSTSEIGRRPFKFTDQHLLEEERNFRKQEHCIHSFFSYHPSSLFTLPSLGRSSGLL